MKKLLSLCALAGSVLAFASPSFGFTNFNEAFWEMHDSARPFIGVDVQRRHMDFQGNFGDDLFADRFTQFDIYGGLKIFDYFGLSVGYERTGTKDEEVTFAAGDNYLGMLLSSPSVFIGDHETKAEIKGIHFDVMFFYPIFCLNW